MKRIPKGFILELVARSSIVDIVSNRVKIKKRGRNYFGCCPFHNEKTPSFSVNDKKQIFHCFGCGASGSVIDFIMEFERLSFVEAVEELANLYSLSVPYADITGEHKTTYKQSEKSELYSLMADTAAFYHHYLFCPAGQQALDYLRGRGLDTATIKRFNLGFAPAGWRDTYRSIAKNDRQQHLYQQAGMLVSTSPQKQYDRFRNRIIFPIKDRRGNVVAFGARSLNNENEVKYLNSPETVIFRKSRQLYGLFESLTSKRDPEQLLVVEGYMDVVTLAQFDINYAIATLGTATTEEHVSLLFRTTNTVAFCYDGDDAGRHAAWRALTTLLPAMVDEKEIKFIFLPEGEDPDSLIKKKGKAEFESYIKNAKPLSQFLFDELLKQCDISTTEGRAKLTSLAIPFINQVKAVNIHHALRRTLGDYLGLLDSLKMNQLFNSNNHGRKRLSLNYHPVAVKLTTVGILIGLLLQYPKLAALLTDTQTIQLSKLPGIDTFLRLISICHRYPAVTTAQLLTEFSQYHNEKILSYLKKLAVWQHHYEEEQLPNIFKSTLKSLYDNILIQRQESLIAKARISGLSHQEKKELTTLLVLLKKG